MRLQVQLLNNKAYEDLSQHGMPLSTEQLASCLVKGSPRLRSGAGHCGSSIMLPLEVCTAAASFPNYCWCWGVAGMPRTEVRSQVVLAVYLPQLAMPKLSVTVVRKIHVQLCHTPCMAMASIIPSKLAPQPCLSLPCSFRCRLAPPASLAYDSSSQKRPQTTPSTAAKPRTAGCC